jgi:hypothetical protein
MFRDIVAERWSVMEQSLRPLLAPRDKIILQLINIVNDRRTIVLYTARSIDES